MRRLALIVLALAAAIAPIPPPFIEAEYSTRAYPAMQRFLTGASNAYSVAWFDGFLLSSALVVLVLLVRRGRILNVLAFFACVWLLFLATWGLNYRRVPLREKLAYDQARLTDENVARLARTAVDQINRLHGPAHALKPATVDDLSTALVPAMERAAGQLGVPPPLPARPKHTALAPYFRRAGIDGMTDPFFLETLLASNLLEIEQPAALAHEWGHLAGFADESEASFFGWLTCLRGDARSQYSGWVALYPHLLGALPPAARKTVHARLAAGPRDDFRRIAARLEETDARVREVANTTYDKFLRANRVEQGIASYDDVVKVVVGASFGPDFTPVLR